MADTPDFDALLSAPLPVLTDDGFSAHVMNRIVQRERVQAALEWSLAIAIAMLLVLFVPARGLFKPIEIVVVELGTSLPFAMACAALALTQAASRLMAD